MISTRRFGRCGNALYMYAHVIALSKKFNIPFHFPTTTDNPTWNPIYFLEYANPNWVQGVEDVLINEVWNTEQHFQEIEWKEEWNGKQVNLNGYWQSWKYFDWCREDVLKAFNFPYEFKDKVCSIHSRRGDYLLYPTKHPVVTMEYINKAIDYILANTDTISFLVFSDDIAWCKENIKGENITYSEGRNEIEDLTLMSHCAHNICSNSTLALWGAELNKNPDKVVVVPSESNWFGWENSAKMTVKDLFRPEWHQIKYD